MATRALDSPPSILPLYARALNLIPEPLAEAPWITVQRFLSDVSVAVPEVYAYDAHVRLILAEDVGELPLFEAALLSDFDKIVHCRRTHRSIDWGGAVRGSSSRERRLCAALAHRHLGCYRRFLICGVEPHAV